MKLQTTIKTEGHLNGKGLFGGKDARVVFRPALPDTGVMFERTDLPEPVNIRALVANVTHRNRRTTLQKGQVSIDTVEHCMASISAMGIDNLAVEIDGPELPAAESSCEPYARLFARLGLVEQGSPRRELVITEPISAISGDASIYALPNGQDGLWVTYDLDYGPHAGVGKQLFSCRVTPEVFEKNIASARTFLLEAEAKQFQARGLGIHLGPRDLLVIGSDGPIKNSFRFPNECVRHKVADLIGDLALLGRRIRGRIVACKSGHALNHEFVRRLDQAVKRAERTEKYGIDAVLDIRQISRILPHRFPLLLVDRVVEIEGETRITAIKNVSMNEPFFQGHFPGTPIMPGVLIVEAMAQVSGLLFAQKLEHAGKLAVLLSMDGVKLRKAVVPGDQLVLVAEAVRMRRRTAQCRCQAMVGNVVAAEAEIKFMLVDDEKI